MIQTIMQCVVILKRLDILYFILFLPNANGDISMKNCIIYVPKKQLVSEKNNYSKLNKLIFNTVLQIKLQIIIFIMHEVF